MGHKEWETDDFLDEFLDFDYRKPVPDHAERVIQERHIRKGVFGRTQDTKREPGHQPWQKSRHSGIALRYRYISQNERRNTA